MIFGWYVGTKMCGGREYDSIDKILGGLLGFFLFREEWRCSFDFSDSDNIRLSK